MGIKSGEKIFVKDYCQNHYFQFKKLWLLLIVVFLKNGKNINQNGKARRLSSFHLSKTHNINQKVVHIYGRLEREKGLMT